MQFGIIGCGTIAQIMHLPYVAEIPETEPYALVDPAPDRTETLGDWYGIDHRFESTEAMLNEISDDLDAVIVSTPINQHADVVEQVLDANISTLVEKPLAVSVEDANRMVAVAERSEATAMVGYMRRYDPAYETAKEEIENLDRIDLVSAYDVDPNHGRIINEVYDLVGGEVPDELIEESAQKQRLDSMQVIDSEDEVRADDYHYHLEHICHEINALRSLLGSVERIDHVDVYADGRYVTAQLVYDGGIRCTLDSGLSERKWFEASLRVDTPNGMVRLEWDNAFIKNTPTELRIKQGTEQLTDETQTPSYAENFKREIKHFAGCVREEQEVRTPFAEARDDVRLIADLFRYDDDANLIGEY
jgi:predicted dehydrogenase